MYLFVNSDDRARPRDRKECGGQKDIYLTALRGRFITAEEALGITCMESTARMALWRLSTKGNLVRVREGLYGAVPPEHVGSGYEFDRFLLFDRVMDRTGALAFHSALELHGAANSRFTTVYYLSAKRSRPFEFQGILYRPVLTSKVFGTTVHYLDDIPVNVTDRERTFLDCIRRPDLCGGVEEYLKSFEAFALMSPDKILEYLERFDEKGLYHKVGFVLSYLKDRVRVPEDLLVSLKARIGPHPCYLVPGKRTGGRLVKEWNVLVPRNLEEMVRFV